MYLGISGRNAILLASSRGLGYACAESLAREGVNVVINGRTAADVETAVSELATKYSVRATGVVGYSSTDEVQQELINACPTPDIVLLNGEGPSPKRFSDISNADMTDSLQRSLTAPLMFLQRVIPGMCERKFGRIIAISSAMVKSPNPAMSL